MKKGCLIAVLMAFVLPAMAIPPTNTTYHFVQINTNCVLVGPGTNLASANGIATTTQVAEALSTRHVISNGAYSANYTGLEDLLRVQGSHLKKAAISFASTRTNAGTVYTNYFFMQVNRFYHLDGSTNVAYLMWDQGNDGEGSGLDADKLDSLDSTDFATSAQGARADTAVQPTSFAPDLIADITTNVNAKIVSLIVSGAGDTNYDGTYYWSDEHNWFQTLDLSHRAMGSGPWYTMDNGSTVGYTCYGSYTGTWDYSEVTNPPAPSAVFGYGDTYTTTTIWQALSEIRSNKAASVWHTNQYLNLDGSTNTLIYLGQP